MEKITKLEVQKRNKERVNVFLDYEYAFSISTELIYKEGIKVKDEVNSEKLKDLAKKDGIIKCREAAIRTIERSLKTEKQVRDKLNLKGYEEEAINKSIDFLKKYNFLDDKDYVKKFIKDKLKSQGSNKIKYSLMQKGIAKELIEEELNSIDKENEKEIAHSLAYKKLNNLKKTENDKYKLSNKLYRFLLSKGYNYEIIKEIVKEIIEFEFVD
ncbi:recombination regulator RecX [Clostridium taeniosporum]|uniref:Regulatory protein RecX n=1 Tax=Clostridium taeniosporum TaxID=394958 RepID=A0A1D7XL23_9CLOT|nr:recombination regulator RecX [Clostridium taeniosporum]AOR24042.1 recombination regulator RecX [Clostridium taeniosporum]